jgi:prepilin-type N-terminal cleavage/methylation domain-containing protein
MRVKKNGESDSGIRFASWSLRRGTFDQEGFSMFLTKVRPNTSSGFTLFELIIALFVVGILAAIATVHTKLVRHKALMAIFYSDIRQVKIAATRFEHDMGFFPPDVWRGVDPGLIEKYGWQNGGHSSKWDSIDLSLWNGPYLENWKDGWKSNPFGGQYDWDNYEEGYSHMGINGPAVFLTLKPNSWGGSTGLPLPVFEDQLEEAGVDASNWPYCVSVKMGDYRNTDLGGGH